MDNEPKEEKTEAKTQEAEASPHSEDPSTPERDAILAPVEPQKEASRESAGLPAFLTTGLLMLSLICAFTLAQRGYGVEQKASASESGSILGGVTGDDQDGIAVVKVYGAIQTGGSKNVFEADSGSDAIVRQLRELSENEHVKAVVIRLNTPGGTVGASQEIFHEIRRLQQSGVKVVASMADVCASGGVYIAAAADTILANAGTLTGSIGVIMQSANIRELLRKAGVDSSVIKSGQFKDIGSMTREMTEREKTILQGIVDSTYEQFVEAVAEGRGKTTSEVMRFADGRIFNGEQAKELGLVDQIGTYQDALETARELAGLEEIHIIRPKDNPFQRFRLLLQNSLNPLGAKVDELMTFQSPLRYEMEGGQL